MPPQCSLFFSFFSSLPCPSNCICNVETSSSPFPSLLFSSSFYVLAFLQHAMTLFTSFTSFSAIRVIRTVHVRLLLLGASAGQKAAAEASSLECCGGGSIVPRPPRLTSPNLAQPNPPSRPSQPSATCSLRAKVCSPGLVISLVSGVCYVFLPLCWCVHVLVAAPFVVQRSVLLLLSFRVGVLTCFFFLLYLFFVFFHMFVFCLPVCCVRVVFFSFSSLLLLFFSGFPHRVLGV